MRTEVDTPDAYRRTMEVTPPPWVTSIDELREVAKYSPLSLKEIDVVLAREERLFGTTAFSGDFFDKRTDFMQSAELLAQETFTKLAPQLCVFVAEYFARGGNFQQDDLEATFAARLKAVDGVFLGDPLLTPTAATYFADYGLIRVNGKTLEAVQLGEKSLEDYFVNTIFAHELLHVMLTSARTTDAMEVDGRLLDLITRNGLATSHLPNEAPVSSQSEIIGHLSWVNEAFIEDVRQQVLNTQAGSYPMKLAVLRTLQTFDEQLELALNKVAITSAPPSQVTQRLESMLGPLGSEHVGDIISSQEAPWENPLIAENMIRSIAAFFPKSGRTQAANELFRQWHIAKQHLLV